MPGVKVDAGTSATVSDTIGVWVSLATLETLSYIVGDVDLESPEEELSVEVLNQALQRGRVEKALIIGARQRDKDSTFKKARPKLRS